jgi:DNA-binding GntR family transcriptional regulator
MSSDLSGDLSGGNATRRVDVVASRLRREIIRGELRQGERLNEVEISVRYGVSRTPVREALRQLARDGLVEVQPYRGASVIKLGQQEIRNVFEAREAIEGMAARLATQRMDGSERLRLLDELKQHRRALESGENIRPPIDLHAVLLAHAANPLLTATMERYHDLLATLRAQSVRVEARRERSSREHLATAERVAEGDADGAEAAMRAHIRSVCTNVLKLHDDEVGWVV